MRTLVINHLYGILERRTGFGSEFADKARRWRTIRAYPSGTNPDPENVQHGFKDSEGQIQISTTPNAKEEHYIKVMRACPVVQKNSEKWKRKGKAAEP